MTPLAILIVEDNTITAMHLQQALEQAGHTVTGMARTFQEAMAAIKDQQPDLALVDIQLGEQSTGNGIATARAMLTRQPMPIIFLTADPEPETYQSAIDMMPAAYLLKPFRIDELLINIDLAYQNFHAVPNVAINAPATDHVWVPVSDGYEKLAVDDVLYIEAAGSYAHIFTLNGEKRTVSANLSTVSQYFRKGGFFRLSRSYVVNVDRVTQIKNDHLLFSDGQTLLAIPASGRKELMRLLSVIRAKLPRQ